MKKLICVQIKIGVSLWLIICLISGSDIIAQDLSNGLEFIENRGQLVDMEGNLRPDILFVGDGGGAKIYLQERMVSYVMSEVEGYEEIDKLEEEIEHEKNEIEKKKKQEKLTALEANAKLKVHRVDMEFVNAKADAKVRVEKSTQGYFNYYLGHCPEGITGVKAHRRIIYENMYPNIDVAFYGGIKEGMEYDFVVHPGGKVEDIILRYKGTDGIEVEGGKLKIKTSLGEIWEEIPEVYQKINGERVKIEAAYVLSSKDRSASGGKENKVKIIVGDYDKSKTLIIDPWITYYGESGTDKGHAIATDGSGNALITGQTFSTAFPITPGAFQTILSGNYDAFVVKLDAAGNQLWATYYGGSAEDRGNGIATDSKGNVLITGYSWSTNFPVTPGAFQMSHGGGSLDAFVVKFDAAGNRLWATYYGGIDTDNGNGIATDGSDNVLLTGYTKSTDFPISLGAFQTSNAGFNNAFVVKLDSAGSLLWATYYGGSDVGSGNGIATDGSNNVMITGSTRSTNFPISSGAYQTGNSGDYDAFVVKLNAAGNRLWATYYGGSNTDSGYDIATDGSGNILITGWTKSTNFPITPGALQTSYGGGNQDAYVVKLDTAGNRLWATYLGGSDREEGWGIAIDGSNNIFVCGDTYSTDISITPGAFQTVKNGPSGSPYEDYYMLKFEPNGDLACGTYLGGDGHDEMSNGGIAVYGGFVYMTGWTQGNFPVTAGAFQTVYGGGSDDVWIAQLCDDCTMDCLVSLTVNAFSSPDIICSGFCANLSAIAASGTGSYTFNWTSIPPGFTSSAQDTVACPDTTTIYVVTVDDGDTTATDSVTVVVLPALIVALGADMIICPGDSIMLDAGNPGSTYLWSTGDSVQTLTVNSSGIYWVSVMSGSGCTGSDTVTITIGPSLSVNLGPDTSICTDDTLILDAGNAGATFNWSTGTATQTIAVSIAGNYFVELTDSNGCNASDSITITVDIICEDIICGDVFVPNIFSPNGDAQNDVLYVYGTCIETIDFIIYDRWGELVYEANSVSQAIDVGWNGKFKGKALNPATFVYTLKITFKNGDEHSEKGNIALVR